MVGVGRLVSNVSNAAVLMTGVRCIHWLERTGAKEIVELEARSGPLLEPSLGSHE